MSLPKRIGVKFFAQGAESVSLPALVPIFQKWIQQKAVEGLLIDAADYKHVPDGPGVMLIGHEGDYSFDLKDGGGLLYVRKRDLPDTLPEALSLTLRLAVQASQKLLEEDAFSGVNFDYSQAIVTFIDRLVAPNTPATFEALEPLIRPCLEDLYGTDSLQLSLAYTDPREIFGVSINVSQATSAQDLLERLSARVS